MLMLIDARHISLMLRHERCRCRHYADITPLMPTLLPLFIDAAAADDAYAADTPKSAMPSALMMMTMAPMIQHERQR